MFLVVNDLHEKVSQKGKTDEILITRNLHSCYNCALVCHENTLVFSQSEAGKFFLHITLLINQGYQGTQASKTIKTMV